MVEKEFLGDEGRRGILDELEYLSWKDLDESIWGDDTGRAIDVDYVINRLSIIQKCLSIEERMDDIRKQAEYLASREIE